MTIIDTNKPVSLNRNFINSVFFIVFLLLLSIANSTAQTCSNNLLSNPGFENGLQDWGVLQVASLSNVSNSGTQAAQIGVGVNRINQALPAVPGNTYHLSAQLQSIPAGEFGTIGIKFLTSDWQPLDDYLSGMILPGGYTQVGELSRTAPPNTAYIEISIYSDNDSDLLVDDVCLTEGTIGSNLPDMIPIVQPGNTSASNNEALTLEIAVQNQGMSTGYNGGYSVFLSSDTQWSNDDLMVLSGSLQPYELAPGETSDFSERSYNIGTSNTFNGTKYMIVVIDRLDNIEESDETNNTMYFPVQISTPTPPVDCSQLLGAGQLLCTEKNGANLEVYLEEGLEMVKYVLNGQGQLISSEYAGLLVYDSVLVQGNQVVKKLVNGSIAYTKNIPQSVLDSLPEVQAAAELTDGTMVLVGYRRVPTPMPLQSARNRLIFIKTDANLNPLQVVSKVVSNNYDPYYNFSDYILAVYPAANAAFDLFYTNTSYGVVTYQDFRMGRFSFGDPSSFDQVSTFVGRSAGLGFTNVLHVIQTPCGSYRFVGPSGYYGIKGHFTAHVVIHFSQEDLSLISSQTEGSGSLDYYGAYDSWGFVSPAPDSLVGRFQFRPGYDPVPPLRFTISPADPPQLAIDLPYFNYKHAVLMPNDEIFLFGTTNGQVFVEVPTDCGSLFPLLADITGTNLLFQTLVPLETGEPLYYSFDIENNGEGSTTDEITITPWFSKDTVLDPDDVAGEDYITTGLPTGYYTGESNFVNIPDNLSSGEYYLLLELDSDEANVEEDESNNLVVSQQPLTVISTSNNCEITVNALNPFCDNNGTQADPTDDTYSFNVTVSGTDFGAGWTLDGTNISGSYNAAPQVLGPFLISQGAQTFTIRDNTYPDCTDSFTVTPPATCSPGNCEMQVDISNVNCTQVNDDWIQVTYNYYLTGTNTPGDWISQMAYGLNQGGGPDLVFIGGGFPAVGLGSTFIPVGENVTSQAFFIPSFNCGVSAELICGGGPGGDIDLELELTQANATPAQWTKYTVVATLTNTGTQAATGVKVAFTKPDGVVYTGGNEYTASQGTFAAFGAEVWDAGSIPPGGTAILEVNYFLLAAAAPNAYAQVTAANETDTDSTPGNGTPPTPNEDDEAAVQGGGPPNLKPDLQLANLFVFNSPVAPGEILNYQFDISNQGNGPANVDFGVKAWISTDNMLSNDDVQDGFVPTGNYPAGFQVEDVPGASMIPVGLADGSYYLILQVDADHEVLESNENNNFIYLPFIIDGGQQICTGDIILESQLEVNDFGNCNVLEGNLIIRSPNGPLGVSSDIFDLSPLAGLKVVEGYIIIENNDELFNLNGLHNITSINGLAIVLSENINQINALSGINGELEYITILNNPSLLNIDGLSGIDKLTSDLTLTTNPALQHLHGLSNLQTIDGEFHLGGNLALTDITGLSRLENIGDALIIENCDVLQNLDGLEEFVSAKGLVLTQNDMLQDITALASLQNLDEYLYIAENPQLADCCILQDFLANQSGGLLITIEDNAGICNSSDEIINGCSSPGGVDLAMTMSADPVNPAIYTTTAITITITNHGTEAATGVWAIFRKPDGVVYEGGNEWTATQGSFYPFGNEWWEVGTLAPGESASLTVSYFVLTSDALTPYAQVTALNEQDVDSTPANGSCCTPLEDDEATILINGFNSGGGVSFSSQEIKGRPVQLASVYPNPVYHGMVNVVILSKLEGDFELECYDLLGRRALIHRVTLEEGRNDWQLDVSNLESGTYYLNMPGQNWRNMPLRLVVARW